MFDLSVLIYVYLYAGSLVLKVFGWAASAGRL